MTTKPLQGAVVAVSGGAGFIGSYLVQRLRMEGVRKIVIIDSLKYGTIQNIVNDPCIELITFELGHGPLPDEIQRALVGIDYLFHLAAEKHNQSLDDGEWILQSNIIGAYSLYEQAARLGVKKIVFSSSLYAYGRVHEPKYLEDELPVPNSMYGISKLTGEQLLRFIDRKYAIPYTVLRYFFAYGPKQYPGTGYKSVIIKNFERMRDNLPPIIFGDGEQVLDYIYVDDIVEATIRSLRPTCNREVINVGSGIPTSINQLTDTMATITGKHFVSEYGPKDETFGTYRVANTEKMRKLLQFTATVPLVAGLRNTYEWVKQSK